MSTATLSASDTEVLEHLASEIDSIKVEGSDDKVSYSPEAWNRAGRVD